VQNGELHSPGRDVEVTNILVRDGLIHAIGSELSAPAGVEVVDATGHIVTPGLVEFSTQVGLVEIWAVDQTTDGNAGTSDPIRAAFRASDALNPQSILVPIARRGGITSVVSHPGGGLVSGQSVWWDLSGESVEQSIVRSPATLDVSGGAGGGATVGQSRATLLMRFRELFADVAAYQADPRAYDAGRLRELTVSRADIEAIIPALDGELPFLVGVHRRADIDRMIALADEYGLDLIIAGGDEAWALADELAAHQVPVVVDAMRNAPYSFESIGARNDNAAILEDAGVSVILTTGSSHNARLLRQYAGNAVRAGMTPEGALAAVTLNPARAVGLDADYGSIDEGKVANLVVWSGDPFELSTHSRFVVIRGEIMSLETRQTRLFQRYRHLTEGVNTARSPE